MEHTPTELTPGTCDECGKNLPKTIQWGATDQGFGLCQAHIIALADSLDSTRAAAPALLSALEASERVLTKCANAGLLNGFNGAFTLTEARAAILAVKGD